MFHSADLGLSIWKHPMAASILRLCIFDCLSGICALRQTSLRRLESVLDVGHADGNVMTAAFSANLMIFTFGSSTQIIKTFKEKDASQLSFSTYASMTLGRFVRILTSLKEGANNLVIFGNTLGTPTALFCLFNLFQGLE